VAARGTVPIGLAATKGTATYYTADGVGGACMPVDRSATGYTVAVGPAEYAEGRACGSYVEVTGARGSVVAKVDDLCPECGRGHLDLSRQAFAAVDDPVKGLVPITYRGLRDPPVAPLVLKVKEGSSRWWLGLHVDNAGNPLAAVEVATDGSSWRALVRQPYGFWTHASDLGGESPLRVRVTDVYGHRVTLDGVRFEVGVLQRTSVRLY
jgi:expansin (peptidoglycan-binding protein)